MNLPITGEKVKMCEREYFTAGDTGLIENGFLYSVISMSSYFSVVQMDYLLNFINKTNCVLYDLFTL